MSRLTKALPIWITLLLGAAALPGQSVEANHPELPRVWLNSDYSPATGKTWDVPAGDSAGFQSALNRSTPGDEIVLHPGAEYVGNFVLPAKAGTKWITIRSSDMSSLPPEHTRINPSYVAHMPKLRTPNSNPVLQNRFDSGRLSDMGAHHYRLMGLYCTNSGYLYNLVMLVSAQDESFSPHDIVVDRCYLHGSDFDHVLSQNGRGIYMGANRMSVVDSWIDNWWAVLGHGETQAIASLDNTGPHKLYNNYLEGASECVIWTLASLHNKLAADIYVAHNYFHKPDAWHKAFLDQAAAGFAPGTEYKYGSFNSKNLLEFKDGLRVLVNNNVLENNWQGGQDGTAILLTVRTGNGDSPSFVDSDIAVLGNIIRDAGGGFSGTYVDDISCDTATLRMKPGMANAPGPCADSKNIWISNVLMERITAARGAGGNRAQCLFTTLHEASYDHITCLSDHVAFSVDAGARNTNISHNVVVNAPFGTIWRPGSESVYALKSGFHGYFRFFNNLLATMNPRALNTATNNYVGEDVLWRRDFPGNVPLPPGSTETFLRPDHKAVLSSSRYATGIGADLSHIDEASIKIGSGPAAHDITHLQVQDIQSNSAKLVYYAPTDEYCVNSLYTDQARTKPVVDLDRTLYPSNGLDYREGNVVYGRRRFVVLGRKAVDQGRDGKNHDHNLPGNTHLYGRTLCPATMASADWDFTTAGTARTGTAPVSLTFSPVPNTGVANVLIESSHTTDFSPNVKLPDTAPVACVKSCSITFQADATQPIYYRWVLRDAQNRILRRTLTGIAHP